MDENSPEVQALAALGPTGAIAFMASTRIALAIAKSMPGCVGKAKHELLDLLALMPKAEENRLYVDLLSLAVAVADEHLNEAARD